MNKTFKDLEVGDWFRMPHDRNNVYMKTNGTLKSAVVGVGSGVLERMSKDQIVVPVSRPEDLPPVEHLHQKIDRLKDELGHAYEALARHLRGRP